jgi:serine protease AprX
VARAVEKGIVVVAAAGNDPYAPLKAPANAPHAITVGGLNDQNTLDPLTNTLYHSTYGNTIDQLQKPDIIAPAIWLPAPILPGTKEHREAITLFDLSHMSDKALKSGLVNLISHTILDQQLVHADPETIRKAINDRIGQSRYISAHYQHADGTSFAAPITCAVIAQMIEANPSLDPSTIREILLATSKKLPAHDANRQGWGLIQPAHAVEMASGRRLSVLPGITPVIDYERMMIDFYLHKKDAESVSLTGDFMQWSHQGLALHKNGTPDEWKASFPFRGKGIYRYKFLIDNQTWLSDPRNFFREPDGFDGFNSKVIVQ